MTAVMTNKSMLILGAAVALSFCLVSDTNAQGFRIGNFIQAGGGQGFRLGGPNAGMHFGGGQGTSIGTQRFGMRFGNGQGARFGGANYGMQFGGGQGTQVGELRTTTAGTPGTYYYGDIQNGGSSARPMVPQPRPDQPVGQPVGQTVGQPTARPASVGPTLIQRPAPVASTGGVIQIDAPPQVPASAASSATSSILQSGAASQTDIARQPNAVVTKPGVPAAGSQAKSVLVTEVVEPAEAPVPTSGSAGKGK